MGGEPPPPLSDSPIGRSRIGVPGALVVVWKQTVVERWLDLDGDTWRPTVGAWKLKGWFGHRRGARGRVGKSWRPLGLIWGRQIWADPTAQIGLYLSAFESSANLPRIELFDWIIKTSEANMNASSINSLLLFLMLFFVASEASFLQHKQDILVYNDLQAGTDLTLHCKSKDDDLGIHVLTYQGNPFEFKFRPHFFGVTLFYCSMEWNGAMHRFDIYEYKRDFDKCIRSRWNIKATGPCMLNYSTSKYDICYPWKTTA
ncbi:hypothetical protein GQ457_16G014040 [Hibiscus cannabinus]